MKETIITHKNLRKGIPAMLTKLEDQVLMAVWKFQGEAYGVNVFQHLLQFV